MISIEITDTFLTIRREDGKSFSVQPIPDALKAAATTLSDYAKTLKTPDQLQAEAMATKLAELMTPEQMAANPAIFPLWTAGLYLPIGAIVQSGGELWRSRQTHTSQPGWEPSNVPALFERVVDTSPTTPSAWTAAVSYKVGDLVTYQDTTYKCVQAHTSQEGWTPTVVPALWSKQ